MSAREAIIPENVTEIPNKVKNPVYLSELLKNEQFVNNEKNLILAGKILAVIRFSQI